MFIKDALIVFGMAAAIIVLIVSVNHGFRLLSRATTPIDVVEVEPGIKCASMVTSDGVALSCWQVNEEW